MLGDFARPYEDHRDIQSISLPQLAIFVDVHLVELGAKFARQRFDGRPRLLTEMTAWTRIDGHPERTLLARGQIPGI
jgi:hypothetical protein